MRTLAFFVLGVLTACSSSSTGPGTGGSDASTAQDATPASDAASGGTDAGKDALPQGRDGGAPGDPCTTKDECREYPCMCNGQRVLQAGCLPAGFCMSQSEVCGGLGCTVTN